MANVRIDGSQLITEMKGIRKIGSFKNELTIPLTSVRGATVDNELPTRWPRFKKSAEWPGRKVLGTDLYGQYLGGTFVQDGDRVFWDVAKPENAIVIVLKDNDFERLYIEVDSPAQTVQLIEAALAELP